MFGMHIMMYLKFWGSVPQPCICLLPPHHIVGIAVGFSGSFHPNAIAGCGGDCAAVPSGTNAELDESAGST